MTHHWNQSPPVDRSAFVGYRFPPEVIMLAVRWDLRYGLSYRDVEELMVAGKWRYFYRAVDQWGHVIDVFVSPRRNFAAARTFFTAALAAHGEPDAVVIDLAQTLETVIEELIPDAFHHTEQYATGGV